VLELEVVGVTARPKSDEQKHRLMDQAQAHAEQTDSPLSDEQKHRLMDQAQAHAEQPDPLGDAQGANRRPRSRVRDRSGGGDGHCLRIARRRDAPGCGRRGGQPGTATGQTDDP
jgi:hypothetical protein